MMERKIDRKQEKYKITNEGGERSQKMKNRKKERKKEKEKRNKEKETSQLVGKLATSEG